MEENRLFELLGKKLSAEATDEELSELKRLLEKYPEALYTAETMQQYWQAAGHSADRIQREAALERHLQRLAVQEAQTPGVVLEAPEVVLEPPEVAPHRTRPTTTRILRWSAALAAAAVLACIVLIPTLKPKETATTSLSSGQHRQKVILPDGSTVWMNTQTTLHYSQGADSIRRVDLEGEAYFTVKHDAAHPFIVHTAHVDIADLGTSFNIKAYPGDKTAEATLIEGAIEVKLERQKHGEVLNRPRQKIIANLVTIAENHDAIDEKPKAIAQDSSAQRPSIIHDSARTGGPADSTLAEIAWMKNMLVFRNESFNDLAQKMERWYGVKIHFADTVPFHYRFSGAFANENLEQALKELNLIKPFTYTITGRSVTIKK